MNAKDFTRKILVIEDNPDVRDNLCELLELSGYQVSSAPDGKKGVKLAIEIKPDLILCDIVMPVLDGYGVLEIVSKNPATSDIPIIFLTAKAGQQDFRKGMNLGAEDYFTKPYNEVKLLQNIERRLKRKEQMQPTPNLLFDFNIDVDKIHHRLMQFAQKGELRKLKKKEFVYHVNELPHFVYFLKEGHLKSFISNDFDRGLIVNIFKSGDFFGYESIITDTPYQTSCASLNDVSIYAIDINKFRTLLLNDHNVNVYFLKQMASKISMHESKFLEYSYDSVRKRVANALCRLYHLDIKKINILREDLAAIAGVAKETAIRTLSDFKSENLIKITGNTIIIQDIIKLENLPN